MTSVWKEDIGTKGTVGLFASKLSLGVMVASLGDRSAKVALESCPQPLRMNLSQQKIVVETLEKIGSCRAGEFV